MIPKEKLEEFKKRLEEGRAVLAKKIAHDIEVVPEFGSDVDSGEEEADESEAFANQRAEVPLLKERLSAVESALQKMEAGTYGTCEKCGMEIEPEVLEVDPESRLCMNCKKNA